MEITLNFAEKIINAAIKKAEEFGIKIIAVVVDANGHLVAVKRMDGAAWGSIDLAINKAYTASAWGIATVDLADSCRSDGPFFGIHFSNNLRLVTFGGGEPIYQESRLIGAIGISGGSVAEDVECAKAGVGVSSVE